MDESLSILELLRRAQAELPQRLNLLALLRGRVTSPPPLRLRPGARPVPFFLAGAQPLLPSAPTPLVRYETPALDEEPERFPIAEPLPSPVEVSPERPKLDEGFEPPPPPIESPGTDVPPERPKMDEGFTDLPLEFKRGATLKGELLKRGYHGTAEAFEDADPGKFDPDGLYGPGFYVTELPDVAAEYGAAAAERRRREGKGKGDERELGVILEVLPGLRNPIDMDAEASFVLRQVAAQIAVALEELVAPFPATRVSHWPALKRYAKKYAAELHELVGDIATSGAELYDKMLGGMDELRGAAENGVLRGSDQRTLLKYGDEPRASALNHLLYDRGVDGVLYTERGFKAQPYDVNVVFPWALAEGRGQVAGKHPLSEAATLPPGAVDKGPAAAAGELSPAVPEFIRSALFRREHDVDDPRLRLPASLERVAREALGVVLVPERDMQPPPPRVRRGTHPLERTYEQLLHIPAAVQRLIKRVSARSGSANIHVGPGSVTSFEQFVYARGKQVPGWPPGTTWDDVAGVYNKRLGVFVGTDGEGGDPVALHEVGHMIDNILGDTSARPEFVALWAVATRALSPYFRQPGNVGPSELFAEAMGVVLGGRESAETRWMDSEAWREVRRYMEYALEELARHVRNLDPRQP